MSSCLDLNAWTECEQQRKTKRELRTSTSKESSQCRPYPVLDRCFEFVHRMIEAFMDPKIWLFALFAAINNVTISLTNQLQLIVVSFGFNPLQTTLLGCVVGVVLIVAIFTSVQIASRIPNSIAWVGIAYFVPSLLGVFLVNFLPWRDKVGLLFSVWIARKHDIPHFR